MAKKSSTNKSSIEDQLKAANFLYLGRGYNFPSLF